MKYAYDSYSDIGGRENNEDSFCAVEKAGSYLFAVADGLGGHENGDIASGNAISVLINRFECEAERFALGEAILTANQLILDKQRQTRKKMMTTVSAVFISGNKIRIANVGDSRTYLFHDSSIVFQTVDHSAAQMAVNMGEIESAQIRNHEDRNILTRALGISESIRVDKTELKTDCFNRLLICSDGFWESVLETEMIRSAKESTKPDVWLKSLKQFHTQKAFDNNDNTTAIAVVRLEP